MIQYLLFTVAGFLSGSILYSYMIAKYFCRIDITEVSDDKNPGAANVIKHAGVKYGIPAIILDVLKGFIPIYLASKHLDIESLYFIPVLAAPVLGHATAPLFNWHGGKAIASSFGCLLGLMPNSYIVLVLAMLLFFFTFFVIIRPNSLRCIVSYALFSMYCLRYCPIPGIRYGGILISIIVIIKHLKGYENTKVTLQFGPWEQLKKII
ncbi:glycerol-3-phosphate acyltransferase PlsY [Herbinix hemicellulosilytica]|uniref:Putative membrane protein n=1 Tax=Herbinix hemicellulosilytica TaxID=1564487 RepID=A0A0H5SGB3_HERHM|nr:glycerol-3-phosphate acyltransferase [Herbinix hemicellulosilytica]RBP60822.1 glycerol-3-phosphate acyltransferase PlsY [Herbinix hemicellulosilytica]CRZ34517.1 putative membrane protein [Herbinix hemicellulosilytica]